MLSPRLEPMVIVLNAAHAALLQDHFDGLTRDQLRCRFGTQPSPSWLRHYIDGLRWEDQEALGILSPDGRLVAFSHVAAVDSTTVELGLSVVADEQRHGHGRRLLHASARHALQRGFQRVRMQCLRDNTVMMAWVRRGQGTVHIEQDEALVEWPASVLALVPLPQTTARPTTENLSIVDLSSRLRHDASPSLHQGSLVP